MRRNYHKSSDCFEYPKNPYLNKATLKNSCQNFATPKHPEIENFKLKKNPKNPSIIPVTKNPKYPPPPAIPGRLESEC